MSLSFKVGDKAVSPAHGVGEVLAIETREIAGQKQSFYKLRIVDTGMTYLVPVDAAGRSLRNVISKRESTKVFDILKSREIAVTAQPWNRRVREYDGMLKSGSPFEVAKVLRDLHRLKQGKELSFGEKDLLLKARLRLAAELALSRGARMEKVEADIQSALDA